MFQVITAGALTLAGLFVLAVGVVGVFRFSTTLNRLHVALRCDALGALLVMMGLMVWSGLTLRSLSLLLTLVVLWLCNAVAGHLIARAEVATNPNLNQVCDYVDLTGENDNVNG